MIAQSFAVRLAEACLLLAFFIPRGAVSGESALRPKTNLETMQDLLGRIAGELGNRSGMRSGDTVEVRTRPAEQGWIAREALTAAFRGSGIQVFVGSDSSKNGQFQLQLYTSDLHVRYDDLYHDGFLGAAKVKRTVSAGVVCDIVRSTGELAYSGSPSLESSDTVNADEVSGLELASAKVTHAELPPERFLDKVLEPLIIIGATGISVFLFFHVRS